MDRVSQLMTMKSLQSIWGRQMSSITIRNLDENLKASLRMRAARHGVSMEQEMRNILQSTLAGIAVMPSG
jgi:hypothetical protein